MPSKNIVGKGENAAFSPFPTMFSTFPKTNFNFWVAIILLSANVFNLDTSKNLLFDKRVKQENIYYCSGFIMNNLFNYSNIKNKDDSYLWQLANNNSFIFNFTGFFPIWSTYM